MFVRVCNDYYQVIGALRDRAVEMQISREDIGKIAGLAGGHASKLLSRKPSKTFGPLTLGATLETLGLRLMLVEDTAASARTVARREPVHASQQRFGNVSRITPKALPALPVPAGKRRGSKYG
ncbi:hypothetical protein AB7G19_17105 [Bradyrhizobium sp. 215_C5_N1_1]|uniref:hypothetical protein n=1 Tax=unclassified Bradyrhizobium TaxID=2631580 RepID=UPI003F8BED89